MSFAADTIAAHRSLSGHVHRDEAELPRVEDAAALARAYGLDFPDLDKLTLQPGEVRVLETVDLPAVSRRAGDVDKRLATVVRINADGLARISARTDVVRPAIDPDQRALLDPGPSQNAPGKSRWLPCMEADVWWIMAAASNPLPKKPKHRDWYDKSWEAVRARSERQHERREREAIDRMRSSSER